MNRHLVGMALSLLLLGIEPAEAQTGARVEYRNGRIGVAVAIGDLPAYGAHPRYRTAGRVAVNWGPVRVLARNRGAYWTRTTLRRNDLRQLLGRETVRRLDRHARAIGLRGPMHGDWYRIDRRTLMLEVTVRGAPVAEMYDYGGDGYMDRMYLVNPRGLGHPYLDRRDRRSKPRGRPW